MSIATTRKPTTRKAENATTTDGPADPTTTLQDALDVRAVPIPPHATTTPPDEMESILAELRAEIGSNGRAVLAWFVRRGALVRRVIDCKLRKATNNATRIKLRKAGLDSAQLTALDAYDPSSEPSPDADTWLRLHWLVTLHPNASNIATVSAARVVATLITRIDPPTTWGGSEEWEIKRQYRAHIGVVVSRVVAENLDRDDTKSLIDSLDGIGSGPAPKAKSADNVKTARQYAARVAKLISDGRVHPETFFDELKAVIEKHGFQLIPNAGRNGISAGTTR
jgi:hypothetical protein